VSFADPQIRYALRFDPIEPEAKITALTAAPNERERDAEPEPEEMPAPQVVSLDAFRRRTPPKT
jgi:hypothetical protein